MGSLSCLSPPHPPLHGTLQVLGWHSLVSCWGMPALLETSGCCEPPCRWTRSRWPCPPGGQSPGP